MADGLDPRVLEDGPDAFVAGVGPLVVAIAKRQEPSAVAASLSRSLVGLSTPGKVGVIVVVPERRAPSGRRVLAAVEDALRPKADAVAALLAVYEEDSPPVSVRSVRARPLARASYPALEVGSIDQGASWVASLLAATGRRHAAADEIVYLVELVRSKAA